MGAKIMQKIRRKKHKTKGKILKKIKQKIGAKKFSGEKVFELKKQIFKAEIGTKMAKIGKKLRN